MLRNLVLAIATILLCSAPALAHKLLLSCTLKADRVWVEVYYDDDTPAQEAMVSLGTSEQHVIASGKTDEHGNWSCPSPGPGTYAIWATSIGHKAKDEISIPADNSPTQVSEEPTREEQTGIPWVKLIVGLWIIGGLALVFWNARRRPPKADVRLE